MGRHGQRCTRLLRQLYLYLPAWLSTVLPHSAGLGQGQDQLQVPRRQRLQVPHPLRPHRPELCVRGRGGAWKRTCGGGCGAAAAVVYPDLTPPPRPASAQPAIFNPETQQWSKPGSLAMAMRPRGYHSLHLLMPDCRVMAAGSDVTGDKTAEFFSPPSLSAGPRPVIVNEPDDINWAQQIAIQYTSQDPVTRVLMIRAGSATHSVNFGEPEARLDLLWCGGCRRHTRRGPQR